MGGRLAVHLAETPGDWFGDEQLVNCYPLGKRLIVAVAALRLTGRTIDFLTVCIVPIPVCTAAATGGGI